ncbi:hypothetical protein AC579_3411 [Pseudocercospora musae]|uniref:WW domain-containing protein n=1 Tax=Pseudocercospora musae TaxID=113226 RepID=A0A139ILU2_9PEZI|nr:hypothetical protein AC579_3411 [Pseudocercospora musae]
MAHRSDIPADAPPSYAQATGSSLSSSHPQAGSSSSNNATNSSHLNVPGASGKGGVPAAYRRSMEDEQRPLPQGWVRTFDPKNNHQFFVDTTKDPPRSIWVHPYDDEEYLNSLTGEERERVEQESINYRDKHHPTKDDYIYAPSDDEGDHRQHSTAGSSDPQLPPRPDGKGKEPEHKSFGRKLKDKVTGTTHEEREKMREQRAEQERQAYEMHMRVRQAMQRAAQTGQPQHIGKDRDGKDIYIQPPQPMGYGGGYGGGYGYPYGGAYGGNGIYTTPNARYITPQQPYGRPYGGGYGGGYGMPLAIGGGLLGGLLLGDLLF